MATVTEKVQEALIGTTEEPQLSQSDRGNFLKHAKTDPEGEHYLDEEGFINAVAPHSEDYVSLTSASTRILHPPNIILAQDQARAIWHTIQDRRPKEQGDCVDARLDSLHKPPRKSRRRV